MTHHTGPAWAIYDALFSHAPATQQSPPRPAAVPPLAFRHPHDSNERNDK